MMNQSSKKEYRLVLKSGINKNQLIKKFKSRQQQKQLQQALVYLKLKQYQCPSNKALIFAKKKQIAIDSTAQKDGPAKYRKLIPLKSDAIITNGWIRGQKLKYKDTICFSQFLKKGSSNVLDSIAKFNKKNRQEQQFFRIKRSQSQINFNLRDSKETLQKIAMIKNNVMKQRQSTNVKAKYGDLELAQTTKYYNQNIPKLNTQSLIVKVSAFDQYLNDEKFELCDTQNYGIAKSMKSIKNTVLEVTTEKRNQILQFNRKLNSGEQSIKNTKTTLFKSTSRSRSKKSKSKYIVSTTDKQIKKRSQLNLFQKNLQKIILEELGLISNDQDPKMVSIRENINDNQMQKQ